MSMSQLLEEIMNQDGSVVWHLFSMCTFIFPSQQNFDTRGRNYQFYSEVVQDAYQDPLSLPSSPYQYNGCQGDLVHPRLLK